MGVREEGWELEALGPRQTTKSGQTWWYQAQRPRLFFLCKRRMEEAVSLRVTCHHWVHWAPKGGVGISTASASGGEEGEHPASGEIQEGGQGACFGHRREPKPDILMSSRVCCSNSARELHLKLLHLPSPPNS